MNYVPVSTSTLRPGVALMFDVYIFYEETYLKYRTSQETFEENKLQQFLNKKIKKVFILDSDEQSYLKYLESALDQLQDEKVDSKQKAEFAKDTMQSEAENIEKNLDNEQAYKNTRNRITKVINFLSNEKDALKNVLGSAGIALDDSQHGANVASLALGLAAKLDWPDPAEVQDLGIAALVHDMGKKKLGIDPNKDRDSLSKEELAKFKKHPEAGVEMMSGKRFITPKVLRLIAEHEEIGQGDGFPEKKNLKKLPQSAQVLNLCNDFDRWCMKNQKSSADGIVPYIEERGKYFSSDLLDLLKESLTS